MRKIDDALARTLLRLAVTHGSLRLSLAEQIDGESITIERRGWLRHRFEVHVTEYCTDAMSNAPTRSTSHELSEDELVAFLCARSLRLEDVLGPRGRIDLDALR